MDSDAGGESCSAGVLDSAACPTPSTTEAVHDLPPHFSPLSCWAPEEQAALEEALQRFPSIKHQPLERYVHIASVIPTKTVREVGLRVQWMAKKEIARRNRKPVVVDDASSARTKRAAVTEGLAPVVKVELGKGGEGSGGLETAGSIAMEMDDGGVAAAVAAAASAAAATSQQQQAAVSQQQQQAALQQHVALQQHLLQQHQIPQQQQHLLLLQQQQEQLQLQQHLIMQRQQHLQQQVQAQAQAQSQALVQAQSQAQQQRQQQQMLHLSMQQQPSPLSPPTAAPASCAAQMPSSSSPPCDPTPPAPPSAGPPTPIPPIITQLLEQNYAILNQLKVNMLAFKVHENTDLLMVFRDNVLQVLGHMSHMPGVMSQMPDLPVQLNLQLANALFPTKPGTNGVVLPGTYPPNNLPMAGANLVPGALVGGLLGAGGLSPGSEGPGLVGMGPPSLPGVLPVPSLGLNQGSGMPSATSAAANAALLGHHNVAMAHAGTGPVHLPGSLMAPDPAAAAAPTGVLPSGELNQSAPTTAAGVATGPLPSSPGASVPPTVAPASMAGFQLPNGNGFGAAMVPGSLPSGTPAVPVPMDTSPMFGVSPQPSSQSQPLAAPTYTLSLPNSSNLVVSLSPPLLSQMHAHQLPLQSGLTLGLPGAGLHLHGIPLQPQTEPGQGPPGLQLLGLAGAPAAQSQSSLSPHLLFHLGSVSAGMSFATASLPASLAPSLPFMRPPPQQQLAGSAGGLGAGGTLPVSMALGVGPVGPQSIQGRSGTEGDPASVAVKMEA